jgi:hypothetical protein
MIQRYLFFFGVRVVTFVVGQLLEEGVDGGGKLAEGLSVFGLVLKKSLMNHVKYGKTNELKIKCLLHLNFLELHKGI